MQRGHVRPTPRPRRDRRREALDRTPTRSEHARIAVAVVCATSSSRAVSARSSAFSLAERTAPLLCPRHTRHCLRHRLTRTQHAPLCLGLHILVPAPRVLDLRETALGLGEREALLPLTLPCCLLHELDGSELVRDVPELGVDGRRATPVSSTPASNAATASILRASSASRSSSTRTCERSSSGHGRRPRPQYRVHLGRLGAKETRRVATSREEVHRRIRDRWDLASSRLIHRVDVEVQATAWLRFDAKTSFAPSADHAVTCPASCPRPPHLREAGRRHRVDLEVEQAVAVGRERDRRPDQAGSELIPAEVVSRVWAEPSAFIV